MSRLWAILGALFVVSSGCGEAVVVTGDYGPDGDDARGVRQDVLVDSAPAIDVARDAATQDVGVRDTGIQRDGTSMDTSPPPPEPDDVEPCNQNADCWDTSIAAHKCRKATIEENYHTGKYNVHRWATTFYDAKRNVVEVTRTAGTWTPVVIIIQSDGTVIFDGRIGLQTGPVQATSKVQKNDRVRVRVDTKSQITADVFVTSEATLQGDFKPRVSTSAEYRLDIESFCKNPPSNGLQLPPNFDANDTVDGYYLLPDSQPSGLYTRKADPCSRGTKLLIKVLYTVALRWNMMRPKYSPIKILDLNEGSCSSVDHATHDDGTHVDIMADCATRVSCSDDQPAKDLAKLFVDTGEVCGIIFNDTSVQQTINSYFQSNYNFNPWHNQFMRTVSGHTHHFHVRVKKPDGTCN